MRGPMTHHRCDCEDRVIALENEIEELTARLARVERLTIADYDAEECLPIVIGDPDEDDGA